MIEEVRRRVLQLVSEQSATQTIDEQDVDSHIRSRDGLIKMFVTQYADDRNIRDIEAIAQRIIETLKWRKSYGITSRRDQDFQLEFYTRNHFRIYEDDEILIGVYDMSSFKKISQKWNDTMQQFYHHIHNKYCLEAVHAGKKVIMVTDGSNLTFEFLNQKLDAENMSILDTHFPCLSDKIGLYGLPWIFSSIGSVFIQLSLPYSMKKRFKIYNKANIREAFDEDHLPILFGGRLALKPVIDVHEVKGLKPLTEFAEDRGFQEWEIEKAVQFYKS